MTNYEKVIHMANDSLARKDVRLNDPWKRLAAAVILRGALDDLGGGYETWMFDYSTPQWYLGRGFPEKSYEFYSSLAGIDEDYDHLLNDIRRRRLKIADLEEAFQ